MTIAFQYVPSDIRVPLVYMETDGSGAAAPQTGEKVALIIAPRLATGTVATAVLKRVDSAAQAAGYWGTGSIMHRMVKAFRAANAFGTLYGIGVDDNAAGVAAAGSFAFTGPATEDGTVYAYIGGVLYAVAVTSGDSATDIGDALEALVTADTEAPVTASNAAGTVTITARNDGTPGNDIDLRVNYRADQSGETLPAGVGCVVTAMSAGATDPALAAAITAMGDSTFDLVALPWVDSTGLGLLAAEFDFDAEGRWGPIRQLFGHVITCDFDTFVNLGTLGGNYNDPHISLFGVYKYPTPSYEITAVITAKVLASIAADAARPFQTLALDGVLPPEPGDRFTIAENNALLFDGIATLYVDDGGTVRIQRMITTYQEDALGNPDTAYLDSQTSFALTELLRRISSAITSSFPRHKLANDGTRFGAGQPVATPAVVKAKILEVYAQAEKDGLVEDYDTFKDSLIVQRNATDSERLDCLIRPDTINGLRIFAVLNRFIK